MKTSFIKPRQKSVFRRDTEFWLWFIGIAIGVLIALFTALQLELFNVRHDIEKAMQDKKFLGSETERLKAEYEKLKKELMLSQEFKTSNVVLKDNLTNLFTIIPDEVTLDKIEIANDSLVLYGTSPSKELYNLHLTPALKSIFTTSETSFSSIEGKGVRFMSINKLEIKETENAGE